ncbi:MAG: hypothetical protein K0Q49_1547 [Haloplasmataceae bacterium]|jgi:glutathione synthase/RimK-type ligase-like ATP-grasp enzyme|nr:hypothetical protein [Haloplasmataceae bacterium]
MHIFNIAEVENVINMGDIMIRIKTNESKEALYIKNGLEMDSSLVDIEVSIRWGYQVNDKDTSIVLNTRQAIKNTLDKENVLLTLYENHIRAPRVIKPGLKTEFPILGRKYKHQDGKDIKVIDSIDECLYGNNDYYVKYVKFNKEYVVHVVNLKVICVEEKVSDEEDFSDIVIRTKAFNYKTVKTSLANLPTKEKDEIESIAVKSIHALGLDFGAVTIGKNDDNLYYAIDVDATCTTENNECLDLYIKELKNTIMLLDGISKEKQDITIGADPECLLKDKNNGNLILASHIVKDGYSIGYDDRSIEASKIDHPVLEIRPVYSTNPIDVYQSVRSLLKTLSQNIGFKNIGVYAGSVPLYNYWTGGHIHFGTKPNSKLIQALDNYLALPLLMIEKSNTARQRNEKYGVLGNFRHKDHGGFEYCTISSWLVSPKITKGVLCLAKVVVEEYLNLSKIYINNYEDVRSYYQIKKDNFRDAIEEIVLEIMKTETYKIYQEEIDYIFNMIEKGEEWAEEKDLRETWKLEINEEEYKIKKACYIPRKTRNKYGIKIGDKVNIHVGGTLLSLDVYPKDDASAFKNGFINFSSDIHYKISVTPNHDLCIYKKINNSEYKIGPVIAIMCDKEENYVGMFGAQTNLFKKMVKIAKSKGILVYVSTIDQFNWDRELVRGYCYDFDKDEWYRDYFPLPNIIYDRGLNICKYNYGKLATEFIDKTEKYNIKFINEPKAIEVISSKWDTNVMLNANEKTKKYIPETLELNTNNLKYMLNKYETIYLKLNDGYGGAGIICIDKINDDTYKVIHKKRDGNNNKDRVAKTDIVNVVKDIIQGEDYTMGHYIVQQGIKFIEHQGRGFELRALMIKNNEGNWLRTAVVGRIRGSTKEFINYWDGFDLSSKLIKDNLAEHETAIRNKINNLTREVSTVIEQNNLHMGEVAIDIGIDENMNLYIIELNSKPDNLLAYIGAYKRRSIAITRIIEYGKYLASK